MFFAKDGIVTVEEGKLRGFLSDKGTGTFLGVPYAAPPVGPLRFRRPQPRAHWFGIREARDFAPCTPQYDVEKGSFYQKEFYPTEKYSDEDGLYLNIWTPAETADAKLPVLVWIHGGGMVEGSGSALQFRGDGLADRGIIVVTINYRLGVFGFFAHPALTAEEGSSGNYALWDQAAALTWVHRNIAQFGGDPENVTVAGQSAGSYCTASLMTAPQTKGLFRRTILQSGSVLRSHRTPVTLAEAETIWGEFAASIGKPDIESLRAMPWQELLALSQKARRISVIVDGVIQTEDPGQTFARGGQHPVDLISLSCADEGCIRQPSPKDAEHYALLLEQAADRGEALRRAFPVEQPGDAYKRLLEISAANTYAGMAALAAAQAKIGTQVWSGCFCHRLPGDGGIGPFHSAELVYEFGTLATSWRPFGQEDYALSATMMDYWANYCRTGNPNGEGLPRWTPFVPGETMRLDVPCSMGEVFTAEQRRAVEAP